ncbi:MAG: insulinase family protein, partial [Alphaproteobacteria bacterium]|nr:insulinase family protein [Alphaproteobacteria bacterium]
MASVAYPDMTVGERWLDIASRLGDHTTEKLQAFKDKHYTADNMALAVVGNVKHEDVVKFAEKHFDGLPEKLADGVDRKPTPAVFRGGMKTFESKEAEEVVLNIAFEGTGEKNPEQSAVDTLLAFILGRGES